MRESSRHTSENSAARSSALGRLRFKIVILSQPLDTRCFTSSLDILPAPMIHTCPQAPATAQLQELRRAKEGESGKEAHLSGPPHMF